MICPFCNSEIPGNSERCFVCDAPLRPQGTPNSQGMSSYYTDMDNIRRQDEGLYKEMQKEAGIKEVKKYPISNGQKIAVAVILFLAVLLTLISLDVFKKIRYNMSGAYDEVRAVVTHVNYTYRRSGRYSYRRTHKVATDCDVAFEYKGEVREGNVKASATCNVGDMMTVYVDVEGNPYHFVLSTGDITQVAIIWAITIFLIGTALNWNKMPNADGHLDKSIQLSSGRSRGMFGSRSRDRWWRYF